MPCVIPEYVAQTSGGQLTTDTLRAESAGSGATPHRQVVDTWRSDPIRDFAVTQNVSSRLALEQHPGGAHAAQEGDIAGHAVCGEVFRRADGGAELLQHAGGGGDELLGIDVQPLQDLRGFAWNVALLVLADHPARGIDAGAIQCDCQIKALPGSETLDELQSNLKEVIALLPDEGRQAVVGIRAFTCVPAETAQRCCQARCRGCAAAARLAQYRAGSPLVWL